MLPHHPESRRTGLRIDWQVFLDAPIDKTDKLLDVVCYTEPVFTPNRPSSYGSLADGHELGLVSTAENRGPGIVKLLVRPHDGLLIWQSDRANIAPKPISPRNLFYIRPEQTVLNPLQDGQVEIVYDPTEAAELMDCVNELGFKARALGYVTDDDDEGRKNEFNQTVLCRTSALETDRITLFITAELEKPGLRIDMDDCRLTKSQQSSDLTYTVPFVMGIGELLFRHETCPTNQIERESSDSQICVCERKSNDDIVALHEQVLLLRNVRVRSTNRMPIRVCLACLGDSHFGFLPIEAEEKLQRERIYPEPVVLRSSSVILIPPRETRKV
ncbi:hypothetical protein FGIG_07055 [Fasciola gigantica]|uniref:Uncharacterized protein n=1 Tax=Fasciola gigantica TaxID=46835 RepID=A0A504YK30_FASGI|nr:hypothetical protein FGIG_07055 [Fasciola gigantica]